MIFIDDFLKVTLFIVTERYSSLNTNEYKLHQWRMRTSTSLRKMGLIQALPKGLKPLLFFICLFFFLLLAKLHITICRLASKTTLQSSLLANAFMYLTLKKKKRNGIYNAGIFFSHLISLPSIQTLPLLRQNKILPCSNLKQGNICRLFLLLEEILYFHQFKCNKLNPCLNENVVSSNQIICTSKFKKCLNDKEVK